MRVHGLLPTPELRLQVGEEATLLREAQAGQHDRCPQQESYAGDLLDCFIWYLAKGVHLFFSSCFSCIPFSVFVFVFLSCILPP